MKKVLPAFFAILFLSLISSCAVEKHSKPASMQVVRDCTGTYLRISGKDYHVCNVGALSAFKEGQMVDADFEKISACGEEPEMVCMMFHENEGWIQVLKIK